MKNLKTTLLFALAVALLSVGCASAGGGGAPAPTPEEEVTAVMDTALNALAGGDIETLTADFSDDFQSNQGQDKAATVEFLNMAKEQGFLEGMTVSRDALAIAVDGDTAEVSGVTIEGAFGVLDLSWKLEKRDGKWWVTYQAQE